MSLKVSTKNQIIQTLTLAPTFGNNNHIMVNLTPIRMIPQISKIPGESKSGHSLKLDDHLRSLHKTKTSLIQVKN